MANHHPLTANHQMYHMWSEDDEWYLWGHGNEQPTRKGPMNEVRFKARELLEPKGKALIVLWWKRDREGYRRVKRIFLTEGIRAHPDVVVEDGGP